MEEKREDPRTENDTRAIAKSWVVTDGGAEIATITMSVTTLRGFQKDQIGNLLKSIAEGSHSFYLEAGNSLKGAL